MIANAPQPEDKAKMSSYTLQESPKAIHLLYFQKTKLAYEVLILVVVYQRCRKVDSGLEVLS